MNTLPIFSLLLLFWLGQYGNAATPCAVTVRGLSVNREEIRKDTDRFLSAVVDAKLAAPQLDEAVRRFEKSMLDKGHESWREGYRVNQENGGKDPDEPRYKPLPKGRETDELRQKIESLQGEERDNFLRANGFRLLPKETGPIQIEQNINQNPANLFLPLHRKLNGVHEDYARLLGEFVKAKLQSGDTRIKRSEITQLSSAIHERWMRDAAWKVQPLLQKAGVSESRFYSLSPAEVVSRCEQMVAEGKNLTAEETAALREFTSYYKLSSADKLLDEQILRDHAENLRATIKASQGK